MTVILNEYDPVTRRALRLWVALSRCGNTIEQHARHDIASHGFKPSEFAVLELLYHKGPVTMSQVAEKVLLTTASVTHVVDQLEKMGLVARVASPEDRRVIHLHLSDAGRASIAACFPRHAQKIVEVVSGLTPEEQEQAILLLKKLGLSAEKLEL